MTIADVDHVLWPIISFLLPLNDENSVVVMQVQAAALCAKHVGDMVAAKIHAIVAVQTHNIIFGGGISCF